jgi:hypothetical protein
VQVVTGDTDSIYVMNWTCHTQSFPCDKARACQKAELFVGLSIVAPIMALQFLEHTKCRALRPLTMQPRITTVTCRATAPMTAAQAPRHRMQPCRAGNNSNILRCFPLLSRTLLTSTRYTLQRINLQASPHLQGTTAAMVHPSLRPPTQT